MLTLLIEKRLNFITFTRIVRYQSMERNQIRVLINAKPKEIRQLYMEHRDVFLSFGKKFGLDYDDLADIYQESFIALRKHALHGNLDAVKSSLKTYLFGIGKFMIFDLLKEKQKTIVYNSSIHQDDESIELIPIEKEKIELSIEQNLLRTNFIKLGKKCQKLLTLFYSEGLTIDEIVEYTNYANGGVVRSQKSRCIKTLKDIIGL